MSHQPTLYIISGCNGAGKTTASFTILPEILNCKEFINADEIARGLSPFQPEKVAIEAGRLMLHRIKELLSQHETFAFETTLASKSYKMTILDAQERGYKVILLFFWLKNVNLAIERVKIRVSEGGHHVEEDVIKRRYINGINNLFNIYLPIIDSAMIFDNSEGKHKIIAKKVFNEDVVIIHKSKYSNLKKSIL